MKQSFALVPFEDHQIMTVKDGDDIHVVMKPIVEALGLDWSSQLKRINRHPVISKGMVVTTIPSVSGVQEMIALKLESFHGWLLSIHPDRIANEPQRDVIIAYQERAFRVIFEHFHGRAGQGQISGGGAQTQYQSHVLKLMNSLKGSRNRAERRVIYAMLEKALIELGLPVPQIDELGQDEPLPSDKVLKFWQAVDILIEADYPVNHSHHEGTMALNMAQIRKWFKQERIKLDIDQALMDALKLSTRPKFKDAKTMRSRFDSRVLHCWIFETNK